MDKSILVPDFQEINHRKGHHFSSGSRPAQVDGQHATASVSTQAYPGCRQIIGEALKRRGSPPNSVEVMLKAWEDSTLKQYNNALALWWRFNNEANLDPFHVSAAKVLEFLTQRYKDGANYGTLNASRSALAVISSQDLGASELIRKFIRGSAKTRPCNPRYDSTWDVDPVLRQLQDWFPLESISLKQLSQKLVLLALGTAHRLQTLALIQISQIVVLEAGLEIRIPGRIKTSGTSNKRVLLKLPFFDERPGLCIAQTLRFYLEATRRLRGDENNNLFISFQRPYKKVSEDTLGRWIRTGLVACGVDSRFTAHSTRHASTSKAFQKGVAIEEIKRVAGWSPASKVFASFYNRPILLPKDTFAETVLTPTQ